MNIKARIIARKVALVIFYRKILSEGFKNSQGKIALESSLLVANLGLEKPSDKDIDELIEQMKDSYTDESLDDVVYLVDEFFSYPRKVEVDYTYVKEILGSKYIDYAAVSEQVDMHTKTFGYDQMDPIDRAILLLAYVEYKQFGTDKGVLVNEMVELAKRYGDEGSKKLIHALVDKLIN